MCRVYVGHIIIILMFEKKSILHWCGFVWTEVMDNGTRAGYYSCFALFYTLFQYYLPLARMQVKKCCLVLQEFKAKVFKLFFEVDFRERKKILKLLSSIDLHLYAFKLWVVHYSVKHLGHLRLLSWNCWVFLSLELIISTLKDNNIW